MTLDGYRLEEKWGEKFDDDKQLLFFLFRIITIESRLKFYSIGLPILAFRFFHSVSNTRVISFETSKKGSCLSEEFNDGSGIYNNRKFELKLVDNPR